MDSCVALFMQRATISEDELREMMHKTTTLSPQRALEYGLIDEIGVAQKEDDPNVKLQEVLTENKELQMELRSRNEHQKQLAEFYQLTHKKKEKKEEKDSTGWGAFFD